jgi:hypothetical protein
MVDLLEVHEVVTPPILEEWEQGGLFCGEHLGDDVDVQQKSLSTLWYVLGWVAAPITWTHTALTSSVMWVVDSLRAVKKRRNVPLTPEETTSRRVIFLPALQAMTDHIVQALVREPRYLTIFTTESWADFMLKHRWRHWEILTAHLVLHGVLTTIDVGTQKVLLFSPEGLVTDSVHLIAKFKVQLEAVDDAVRRWENRLQEIHDVGAEDRAELEHLRRSLEANKLIHIEMLKWDAKIVQNSWGLDECAEFLRGKLEHFPDEYPVVVS